MQAPYLELKTILEHLRYAYLGEKETLLVIISTKLTIVEEEERVTTLKQYKEAIGWTIPDIKGLSLSLCMHNIHMKEDYKPSREAKRCFEPSNDGGCKHKFFKVLECRNDLSYIGLQGGKPHSSCTQKDRYHHY